MFGEVSRHVIHWPPYRIGERRPRSRNKQRAVQEEDGLRSECVGRWSFLRVLLAQAE